ncbi:MAG: riboflavin synthase [Sphingobium sp.]
MFTGIITDIGTIRNAEQRGDLRLVVEPAYDTATVDLGASIACSGVCLTVVDKGSGWFAVDVSGETRSRTADGQWLAGSRLNLERAMKLGEELGGHIVTGHVDGIGTVVSVEAEGDSHRIVVSAPADLAPFIAPKGSIALDGISLTVNTVEDDAAGTRFSINIIPHTAEMTTFSTLEPGRPLNIEIDVLARYLGRMRSVLEKSTA